MLRYNTVKKMFIPTGRQTLTYSSTLQVLRCTFLSLHATSMALPKLAFPPPHYVTKLLLGHIQRTCTSFDPSRGG